MLGLAQTFHFSDLFGVLGAETEGGSGVYYEYNDECNNMSLLRPATQI